MRFVPSWLGAMIADREARTRRERTRADRVADVLVFVFVIGAMIALAASRDPDMSLSPVTEVAGGLLAAIALLWRRNRPFTVVLVALTLSVISGSAAFAGVIALYALGRYGAPRDALIGLGLGVCVLVPQALLLKGTDPAEFVPEITWGLFITLVCALAGMWMGTRAELVATLRLQLSQGEAEQRRKVREAQLEERSRIARETHDVLAHRLAQLSIHAGALEYRADASPQEISRSAGAIRETAHHALEELREVIGVLRADELIEVPDTLGGAGEGGGDAFASEPPHQTLDYLDELVSEWRAAGAQIDVAVAPELDLGAVPSTSSRGAYRVAQEALTNAAKHAPGARVALRVDGGPVEGLRIEVRNALPVGAAVGRSDQIPGAGVGLVGLHERVRLAGGDFESGTDDDGHYVLTARFPWARPGPAPTDQARA